MINQSLNALIHSNLTLFMVDTKEGITTEDILISKWIKRKLNQTENVLENKKTSNDILLIANKSENDRYENIINDVYKLGLGEPIYISAEHGDGMMDLLAILSKKIPDQKRQEYEDIKEKRGYKHI